MSIIISKNGKGAKRVNRTSFENEDELQRYIEENPESIPLYDIKEDIRLLIVAREFPTQSGPIDAVGVDKDGELYLVETKLYKNTDKRNVVAQVLDYGASLWKHSSEDWDGFRAELERQTQKRWSMSLQQKLQDFFDIPEEQTLTLLENLSEHLDEGEFKFVILMDTLHDQLKDLILFINQNSKFSIFIAEMEYYKHEEYEILIPRLYGAEVKKDVAVSSSRRKTVTLEEFLADIGDPVSRSLLLEMREEILKLSDGIQEKINPTGISFRFNTDLLCQIYPLNTPSVRVYFRKDIVARKELQGLEISEGAKEFNVVYHSKKELQQVLAAIRGAVALRNPVVL